MRITQAIKALSINKSSVLGSSFPLTFLAKQNLVSLKLLKIGNPYQISLKIRKNNFKYWINYSVGDEIILNEGDKVSFLNCNIIFNNNGNLNLPFQGVFLNRNLKIDLLQNSYQPPSKLGNDLLIQNDNNVNFSKSQNDYYYFEIKKLSSNFSYESDGNGVEAYGNVMSLVNFAKDITNEFLFANLFKDCKLLITAPLLPAKHLKPACYYNMFNGCTKLTDKGFPILPAKTLKNFCYAGMFQNCNSLTGVITLSAETLAPFCYTSMFWSCENLSGAILPARTLKRRMLFKYV